ncbi:NAD(P)-binding protein [Favolaschia claudopus]|uniref:NAD(P)-binding protein n=1 Tax=Favolaschia claudopus TaxID=2862362 RepID=A0AAW0A5U8_9AGAR
MHSYPANAAAAHRKVIVITGAYRSVGAAVAKHMAYRGAKVVVNYASANNAPAADEVVSFITSAGGTAVAIQADVSTVAGGKHLVNEAVKAFGGIDVLVLYNAVMRMNVLKDMEEEYFDAHFAENVKGPLFLAKAAAPLLPSPIGRIIFFSTSNTADSAIDSGVPANSLVYTASRGTIEQLSRILAKDLGARGITVNTVSPGPVDLFVNATHAGRLGRAEEVAEVAGFLQVRRGRVG